MNQKRKKNRTFSRSIGEGGTFLYIIAMGIFPLVYGRRYTDMITAKNRFFIITSIMLLLLTAAAFFAGLMEQKRQNKTIRIKKLSLTDVFALILFVSVVLSTVFCEDQENAFWGLRDRKFGAIILLLGVLVYFSISRLFKPMRSLWVYFALSSLVFLVQILNTWQLDPLNISGEVGGKLGSLYLSTLGNLNFNAAFDTVMLSIGMGLYFLEEERNWRRAGAVFLFLGFSALICCRSDLGLLGIFAAFFVLSWFGLSGSREAVKFMELICLLGCSAFAAALARKIWAGRAAAFDSLSGILTGLPAAIFIPMAGGVCLSLFLYQEKKALKRELVLKRIRSVIFTAGLLCSVSFILAVILANSGYAPGFLKYFILSDDFGNARGYIWSRTWKAFLSSPFRVQMLGCGVNNYPDFINPLYYEEMISRFHGHFIDAHNECLQFLVTTGVFGTAGYFGMLVSSFFLSLKTQKKRREFIIPILVFSAFLVQGLANSPHITITPIIFIFLGITEALRRDTLDFSG